MLSRIEPYKRKSVYHSLLARANGRTPNRLAAKLRADYARKRDFKLDNEEADALFISNIDKHL